jgi:anhydro-N-acetylmuramic acid kinase
MSTEYYLGLMSGTSADAIDVALVDFANNNIHLAATYSQALPADIREQIHNLTSPANNEIDRMGELDHRLGETFSDAINQLLTTTGIGSQQIIAIGSHGQTIRHRPPGTLKYPFTLQIGDPNIIAERTGITTVADFRRRDMAAGGHGAPLVPAFHHTIFQHQDIDRAVINIGGMANITWLPKSGQTLGFDTGPGNVLMDTWILKNLGKSYDSNGEWGASGQVNSDLLQSLLGHPFFTQTPPKSTGREMFNFAWIEAQIAHRNLAPADIQATLLALTAQSIAQDICQLTASPCEVYICGGGAYNLALMAELAKRLPHANVASTKALGIAPEWIEAMAFAWLAQQTINRRHGNLNAVTGAQREVILGGVYFA